MANDDSRPIMTRSSRSSKPRLLVFAKAPIVGAVKTRLHTVLSAEQATHIHCQLLEHCLATLLPNENYAVELWVGEQHSYWHSLIAKFEVPVYLQQGEDLGARMDQALTAALQRCDRAVVMGSDCPYLTPDYIDQAFAGLDQSDVVIGPATDGGYVLLGLRAPQPQLFTDMEWGEDTVLAVTQQRICDSGLTALELSMQQDIDWPEDLLSLQQRIPAITAGIILSGEKID